MASNFNDTTPPAPNGFKNVAWQTDGAGNDSANVLNIAGVNAQTGTTYTVLDTDTGKLVSIGNGSSVAVTLGPLTLFTRFYFAIENTGAGTVTVTPGSGTIDGVSNIALTTNHGVIIYSDGTNYFTMRGSPAGSSGTVTSVDGSGQQGVETDQGGAVAAITTSGTVKGCKLVVTKTGNYSLLDTDRGKFLIFSDGTNDAITLTLASGTSFSNGWFVIFKNKGTSTLTFSGTNCTINGAASLVVPAGTVICLVSDGGTSTTNYHTENISPLAFIAQNLVWASPNGTSGMPTFRALVLADLPTGSLTGIVRGGNPLTAAELSGDVTTSGSNVTTIATGAVTDDKGSLLNKPSVGLVATANLTLSGAQTIDGALGSAGTTLVLATAQSTGSQNGPWVMQSGAWTRPTWYPSGGTTQALQFSTTLARLGTLYSGTVWRLTTSGAITIDTTATTWSQTPMAVNSTSVTNGVLGTGAVVLATAVANPANLPSLGSFNWAWDDFFFSSSGALSGPLNASGGTGVGINWILGIGTFARLATATSGANGEISCTTGAVSGNQAYLIETNNNTTANVAAFGSTTFDIHFRILLSSTASIAAFFGINKGDAVASASTDYIAIEYDTSASDTIWMATVKTGGTGTRTAITGSVVDTNYHTLRIRSTVAGTILFSVDGGAEISVSANISTARLTTIPSVTTKTAAGKAFTIDYFQRWFATNRG